MRESARGRWGGGQCGRVGVPFERRVDTTRATMAAAAAAATAPNVALVVRVERADMVAVVLGARGDTQAMYTSIF